MSILNAFLNLTEMETVHQIERMHAYPPRLYFLANILEYRPEFIFIYKINNSFFNFIDTTRFIYNKNNIYIFLFLIIIILVFCKIFCGQKKH